MNVRALPATLEIDWRRVGLAILVTVNAVLLAVIAAAFLRADINSDWLLSYAPAGERVVNGGLYDWTELAYGVHYVYRYSPLLAYGFAAIAWIGPLGWSVLHFAPLLALPRRVAGLVLLSAPFWADVYYGNITTFAFVAAFLALRGGRVGMFAFLAMALLAPRPIMLPVLFWILWQRSEWRWPFVGLVAANVILVGLTGLGPEWASSLLRAGDDFAGRADFGPALVLGSGWPVIGLPLAAWLTWKGRLGLASVAASPYWLLHYLLMGLVDIERPARTS